MSDKGLINELKLAVPPQHLAVSVPYKVIGDFPVTLLMVHISVEDEPDQRCFILIDLQNAFLALICGRPEPVPLWRLTAVMTPLPGFFDPSCERLGKYVLPFHLRQTGHN